MLTLEDIDKSIKLFYKENGRTPKLLEITVKNGFPCNKETLLKKFGKYNEILEKLGYETFSYGERRYNKKQLLINLKKSIVKHRTSNYHIIRVEKEIVYREIYKRIFGSYVEAVRLSGISRNKLYLIEMFDNYNLENEIDFLINEISPGGLTDAHLELMMVVKDIPDELFTRDYVAKKIPIRKMYSLFKNFSIFCILCNKTIKSIFKRQHIASDGHVCDSYEECVVDNFLSSNNILHETQVKYPGCKMTADFKVDNTFIEYTKFKESSISKEYLKRLEKKKQICKDNNIEFIEIDDISEEKLQELLRRL